MSKLSLVAEPVKQELVITRVFDAPREPVWKAWTEPERLRRWWGPKDYTAPVCKVDLRVGGKYLFCSDRPTVRTFGARAFIAKSFRLSGLSAPIALRMSMATSFQQHITG